MEERARQFLLKLKLQVSLPRTMKKTKSYFKKLNTEGFRKLLIFIPIFLLFLTFYNPFRNLEFNSEFLREPVMGDIKVYTDVSLTQNIIEDAAKIPASLDYKRICFHNKGIPRENCNFRAELLRINSISQKANQKELFINYQEKKCMWFKGDSYLYSWEFRYDPSIGMSSIECNPPENYTPPDPHNINLVLKPFPMSKSFDKSIPASDYTNETIRIHPLSTILKLILFGAAWCGLVLLWSRTWQFIKKGK